MADVDADIRQRLERLTRVDEPSAETWERLRRRRGRRRLRNIGTGALALVFIATIVVVAPGRGDDEQDTATTGSSSVSSEQPADAQVPRADATIDVPEVEVATSPLRAAAADRFYEHVVTLTNRGSDEVHLNDFRTGQLLGDREILVATEGCGPSNATPTVVCQYNFRPVTIAPGETYEFTITLWSGLEGMGPVSDEPIEWRLPLSYGTAQFTHPDEVGEAAILAITYTALASPPS